MRSYMDLDTSLRCIESSQAIFTMLGAPLERRLGLAARQAGGA